MTALNKKVAIVTGSTSGIGEAIARMLSLENVQVVINSVSSQEKGQALAHELQGLYCQANIAIEVDCHRLAGFLHPKFLKYIEYEITEVNLK